VAEPKILLIDDDKTLLSLVSDQLQTAGYETVLAENGNDGLRMANEVEPDLVIVDVMMPGLDGWEVCKQLREYSLVPILMLTAKGEEVDKLRGFQLGIDDYVTKPFSFAELVARVGAVLSRIQRNGKFINQVTSGDLHLNFEDRRVIRGTHIVELSPTEYRLLEILARSSGRTVSTEELLHNVWGPEYAGESRHVKHYIWALRKKIEDDPGDPKHILTERGYGYRFE
jgi:two-component system KDP operon response regulator KdpE